MKIKLPPLFAAQREIADDPARFKVLSCGRRWGKTQLCSVMALATALGGGVVWWVAPTSENAKRGWEKVEPLAKAIPGSRVKYADREVHFPGGGWIAFRSADSKSSLRGPGVDLMILDEAAYIPVERWRGELRPTLSDKQGGAVFISTPAGRNWFYEMYQRGQDGDFAGWASWQLPTSSNPYIPDGEVAEAARELPEWYYRQEYLAEFMTFAGKVYKSFSAESDAVFTLESLATYREYWGGIDFGYRNPTAVVVGGLDRDDRLDIVDGLYQREMTTPELADVLLRLQDEYEVSRWFADPADPGGIQELRSAGLPVVGAPRVKGEVDRSYIKSGIVKVETRLVTGRLRVADHLAAHIRELEMYRYPDGRSGGEEKETPLKVDDHVADALRYMVVGLDQLRGRLPRVRVAA